MAAFACRLESIAIGPVLDFSNLTHLSAILR